MPVKKSKSNGSTNGSVADFETINIALNSDPEPENQTPEPTKAEDLISDEIASRYFDSIPDIAAQVASEFWSRMDKAIAQAIVENVPQKFVRLRFSTPQQKTVHTVDTKAIEGSKP